MRFAFDSIPDTQVPDIARWLSAPPEGCRGWLLVDAALVDADKLAAMAVSRGWSMQSALHHSAVAAYGKHAPQLIPLPAQAEAIASMLSSVLRLDRTAPALSWFWSPAAADHLLATFASLAVARIDGDLQMHCRFADARVLPVLLDTLNDAQHASLAQVIPAWQCFDRRAGVHQWKAKTATSTVLLEQGKFLELDTVQFERLMAASEADTMFYALSDQVPELVPSQSLGAFHARLQAYLQHASSLQVTQAPDRLQFLVLSVGSGEYFWQHPDLQSTWEAMRTNGARLCDLMDGWSSAVWQSLEAARQTKGQIP